jgi:hypothetical protein
MVVTDQKDIKNILKLIEIMSWQKHISYSTIML